MAAVIGALRADLSATVAQFEQDMGAAAKAVERFGKRAESVSASLSDVGARMSVAITAPFIALSYRALQGAKDANNASGQVQAALTSMGNASGKTLEELKALSLELRGMSTFDDDDILAKSTANLLTFGNVSGAVFDRASKAILDVSARLQQDLQPSTMLVGKALNDPIRGLTQLRRVGIQFTDSQVAMVKRLVETNKMVEAQGILLGELERQFGGSAAAQRAADPWANLRDIWRDVEGVLERIAMDVLPPLIAVVERAGNAFLNMSEGMQDTIVGFVAVAAATGPLLLALGAVVGIIGQLAPVWAGFVKLFTDAALAAGITNIGVAIRAVVGYLAPWVGVIALAVAAMWKFRGAFVEAFGYVVTQFQTQVMPALQRLGQAFAGLFAAIEDLLTNGPIAELVNFIGWAVAEITALLAQGLGHAFLTVVSTIADAITTVINLVSGLVKIISALLKGDFAGAWDLAKDTVSDFAAGILRTLENLIPGITGFAQACFEGLKAWMGDAVANLLTWIEGRFPGLIAAVRDAAVGAVAWAKNLYQGIKTWIGDNLGPLIKWAQDRIRELNQLFGMIRRRQAQVSGSNAPAPAPAPTPAPAARGGGAPAPTAQGGGGGGGKSASDKTADKLKAATEKMREALEDVNTSVDKAFDRRALPRSIQQANDLTRKLEEIEKEARESGVSMEQFAKGLADARERIEQLKLEGLAREAADFRREVEALKDEVTDFGGGLPPLERQLAQVDSAYDSLKREIQEAIEENKALADSNDEAKKAMEELERQLGRLESAHQSATAAAKATYEAEERVRNLQSARDAQDTGNDIRDFRQRASGGISNSQSELQRVEDDLQRKRIDAQIELASLEADRLEAERVGDENQVARLNTQIGLQTQLYDLVAATTAQQIISADRVREAFTNFADDLSNSLADQIVNWKGDLEGVRGIFKQLAKDLFIKPGTDAIAQGLSGFMKSFAGGFAVGGTLSPGQWGIAGENGPEPIFAGAQRMSVVSNEDSFGRRGGGTNIFNITTPNADSFRNSQRQIARRANQTLGTA